MDDTKRVELEETCKTIKLDQYGCSTHGSRAQHVRERDCRHSRTLPEMVRNWLRRYDEGGLEGLRDLPRCGRPRRILRDLEYGLISSCAMDHIPLPSLRLQQATRTSLALPGDDHSIMRQIFSLPVSGRNLHPLGSLAPLRTSARENAMRVRNVCPDQNLSVN